METTTTASKTELVKDQLAEVFNENFGCVVQEAVDPEAIAYVRVNTLETLNANHLEKLLEFKDQHNFDEVHVKRSGAGLKIEFKLL